MHNEIPTVVYVLQLLESLKVCDCCVQENKWADRDFHWINVIYKTVPNINLKTDKYNF